MAMPKFNKPEGMLDSIKSKLGFSDGGDYYDRGRKDYDDYDSGDYDDYDDDYEEDDAAPSSNYDPYDSVTTRPARGNHARTSVGSGGYRPAKLVSIDDVRAHTTVPDSLNRDPLPPRKVSSASFGNRTMVDPAFTAPANTPNARAAAAADQERSESLNALFSTTAAEAAESQRRPDRPDGREAYRRRVHGGCQGCFRRLLVRSVQGLRGHRNGHAQPHAFGHHRQAHQLRRVREGRKSPQSRRRRGARAQGNPRCAG